MMHLADTIDDGPVFFIQLDHNLAVVEPKRMTKRNQFMSTLCAHDTGYDRCCKYRPFRRFDVATRKTARNVRGEFNQGTGMCRPICRSLVADVDHCRPVALINMTEFAHLSG